MASTNNAVIKIVDDPPAFRKFSWNSKALQFEWVDGKTKCSRENRQAALSMIPKAKKHVKRKPDKWGARDVVCQIWIDGGTVERTVWL